MNDTLLLQESNGRPDSAEQTQREFSEVKINLITHAVCHMCIKTGANCRQTLDKTEVCLLGTSLKIIYSSAKNPN